MYLLLSWSYSLTVSSSQRGPAGAGVSSLKWHTWAQAGWWLILLDSLEGGLGRSYHPGWRLADPGDPSQLSKCPAGVGVAEALRAWPPAFEGPPAWDLGQRHTAWAITSVPSTASQPNPTWLGPAKCAATNGHRGRSNRAAWPGSQRRGPPSPFPTRGLMEETQGLQRRRGGVPTDKAVFCFPNPGQGLRLGLWLKIPISECDGMFPRNETILKWKWLDTDYKIVLTSVFPMLSIKRVVVFLSREKEVSYKNEADLLLTHSWVKVCSI